MKSYKIGTVGGDGIGPEVTAEGVKVLKAAARIFGFGLEIIDYPFGAEHYLKTKELITDAKLEEIRKLDSVLLGAIGDPRMPRGLLEFGIIMRLRVDLDLYVNLRPLTCYAEKLNPLKHTTAKDLNILVCRENTEGLYRGDPKFDNKGTPEEVAHFSTKYTRAGTERIIRFAYERAMKRKKKLTLVDKANAVRVHDLYRRTFAEVGKEFPEVEQDSAYVDAFCMWLIKNPQSFDTVVTTNMFGDIVTDLGAALQGGLGLAAGGNVHPGKVSVFEPIHGSAPKHAGTGKASPLATILAAGLLLDHVGEEKAAGAVEQAVVDLLNSDRLPSVGTDSGIHCSRQGDMVVEGLEKVAAASQT